MRRFLFVLLLTQIFGRIASCLIFWGLKLDKVQLNSVFIISAIIMLGSGTRLSVMGSHSSIATEHQDDQQSHRLINQTTNACQTGMD